jgi:hypothetical protein
MIVAKCFKCGGERTLISNSMQKPDYASHTEDECIVALNERITVLEQNARTRYNADHYGAVDVI